MLKSYFKYELQKRFGIISHPNTPLVYDHSGNVILSGKYSLQFFQIRSLTPIYKISLPVNQHITTFTISSNSHYIIIGTNEGYIFIYRKIHEKVEYVKELEIKGHKTGVNCLIITKDNTLISGGRDSEIIFWDIVSNCSEFRLRGHKNEITSLVFLEFSNLLLSGSKDCLLKIWEVETQHCVQTISLKSEIWSLIVDKMEDRLICGLNEKNLMVWNISNLKNEIGSKKVFQRKIEFIGNLIRKSEKKVKNLKFHNDGKFLCVNGDEKYIEIFQVLSRKKQKIKFELGFKEFVKMKNNNENSMVDDDQRDNMDDLMKEFRSNIAKYEFKIIKPLYSNNRITNFAFHPLDSLTDNTPSLRILLSTNINSVEEWNIRNINNFQQNFSLEKDGHHKEINSLSLSSDDLFLCSLSPRECKVWNIETSVCVRTFNDIGNASCVKFLPGNQHLVIGTKRGEIKLFDISSSKLVEYVSKAHGGSVKSIVSTPDKNGIITCSVDKTIKFWKFNMKIDKKLNVRQIGLSLFHTLQMTDEIVCMNSSRRGTYLGISLIDTTVKIFYLNTLKFYLSFYGHNLPVLSLDFSSDEFLCVTGSSDKNIKIWGLQFGNCMKSIFAHQSAITGVRFVENTHHFFSISKDGALKRWDGDKYECIQILQKECRFDPLTNLCVSNKGDVVLTSCKDKSISVYKQTENILYLQEEKEKRIEKEYEKELVNSQEFVNISNKQTESSHAGKRTIEIIKFGDDLIECVNVIMEDEKNWNEYNEKISNRIKADKPLKNISLLGMNYNKYLLHSIKKIKLSDIETILAVLPYQHAIFLLKRIEVLFVEKEVFNIQIITRIVTILCKIHKRTISKDISLFNLVKSLSTHIKTSLQREKKSIGFNIIAVDYVKKRLEGEKYLRDVYDEFEKGLKENKKKKRKRNKNDEKERKKIKKKLKIDRK